MKDEKRGMGSPLGRFQLGENYGEAGPGLGCMYEAWRVGEGSPSLVLVPGEDVEWRPSGPWRVCLSCDPAEDAVALDVKEAPPGAPVTELANLFVLMTPALERAEHHPRVQAHLARGPVHPHAPWATRAWRLVSEPVLAVTAVFALGLGVGWFIARVPSLPDEPSWVRDSATVDTAGAPYPHAGEPDAGTVAYPLPDKPMADQATAPCDTRRFEEDINGGCWVELAHRPPCLKEAHAEHRGKCYLPVAKRTRLPQAVTPAGQ